jgi:uncharacterized protein DUF4105
LQTLFAPSFLTAGFEGCSILSPVTRLIEDIPMIRFPRPALAALMLFLAAPPAQAQLPDSLSRVGRISVLTAVPGDRIYSRYGHTAFRVNDRELGLDVTFNYGTFDFDTPGFLGRFIQGEMDYYLSFSSTRRAIQAYEVQNRTVRQQLLDLSREDRDRLYAALLENSKPENRTYRYDFLFDNCSTRPRDLLDRSLGGAVTWDDSTASEASFRQLLDPYHAGSPALDLGTDLVLGSRLDREALPEEETFLPMGLEDYLSRAWITDQYGRRPLVLVHDTLSWSPRPAMPDRAFPWITVLTSLMLLSGLAILWLRPGPAPTVGSGDRWIMALLGMVGLLLLYMATATAHVVTEGNYNLLWALPTHIAAAFVINRLPVRLSAAYLLLSAFLAVLSLTGGTLLPQPIPTAMVPIALLAAARFGVKGWRMWKSASVA